MTARLHPPVLWNVIYEKKNQTILLTAMVASSATGAPVVGSPFLSPPLAHAVSIYSSYILGVIHPSNSFWLLFASLLI